MIHKSFDLIERVDIDSLVTNQVKEGRTIEDKQCLPGNADKDKKEFLADASVSEQRHWRSSAHLPHNGPLTSASAAFSASVPAGRPGSDARSASSPGLR